MTSLRLPKESSQNDCCKRHPLPKPAVLQSRTLRSFCWGLSLAKLYCITFGHGDRFTQWPVPAWLARQIACKLLRQILCKVTFNV